MRGKWPQYIANFPPTYIELNLARIANNEISHYNSLKKIVKVLVFNTPQEIGFGIIKVQ